MTATRDTFAGLETWQIALWYGLIVLSVAIFVYGVLRLLLKYRRGRGHEKFGNRRERAERVARVVFTHAWIRRRDPMAGLGHLLVFYGFMVLFAGTVILADEGGHYTATFNLTTTYPGADQAMPAEVIGKGEGTIDGRTLMGSAHTQVVMATVPGVDPGFAFVPRMVSTRIESKTLTQIAADGGVSIEIENTPAPGESYAPTRTTLRGTRVSAGGIARGVAKAPAPN